MSASNYKRSREVLQALIQGYRPGHRNRAAGGRGPESR
jgi:hypothetical protein